MSEIGVGQGAVLSRAEEAALNLTSDQKHNVEVIQAAIDAAVAEVKPPEPVEAPAEETAAQVAAEQATVAAAPAKDDDDDEPHKRRRR